MQKIDQILEESLKELHDYCYRQNYKGYSLYDSHNSFLPLGKLGPIISFYSNQFIKRSPLNIRSLIGIKKEYNPKGVGLFLNAYCNLWNLGIIDKSELKNRIDFFYNWLKDNYSRNFKGYSWGYNYDWPKKDGSIVPSFTPSTVVTGFNARAILNYYELFRDKSAVTILKGAEDFVLNEIPFLENDKGICYSYIPLKQDITINANLLAAEILAYSDYVQNKKTNQNRIKKVLDFTINHQNADGSWYYSYDIKTYNPKKQIDFHQGYVLESIARLCRYSDLYEKDYKSSIQKGLKFYFTTQFHPDGFSYWRFPSKWPVDIHNQSEGIIIFSLFKDYDSNFSPFAKKLLNWTIDNMQSKQGNFYYQKWPMITNKISYMRWNQAWMMNAFSVFMKELMNRDQ